VDAVMCLGDTVERQRAGQESRADLDPSRAI
jgi:hypothetical protein